MVDGSNQTVILHTPNESWNSGMFFIGRVDVMVELAYIRRMSILRTKQANFCFSFFSPHVGLFS